MELTVLSPVADVGSRWVIVQEGSAREAYAVKIEDDINRVDRPRLVPNFHSPQYDLIEEAC